MIMTNRWSSSGSGAPELAFLMEKINEK